MPRHLLFKATVKLARISRQIRNPAHLRNLAGRDSPSIEKPSIKPSPRANLHFQIDWNSGCYHRMFLPYPLTASSRLHRYSPFALLMRIQKKLWRPVKLRKKSVPAHLPCRPDWRRRDHRSWLSYLTNWHYSTHLSHSLKPPPRLRTQGAVRLQEANRPQIVSRSCRSLESCSTGC